MHVDQKSFIVLSKWLLVLGGFSLGYKGLMGVDLVDQMFGTLAMYVNVVGFGVPAVYLAYVMLTKKKK